MPIHLRAEPGDYADAVLLPGDPLRAKYIAETYFDDVTQVNGERGLLGYTGTWEGKPRLGAGNRDGLPGRDDRLRGAHPARLQAADARRHLRRAAAASRARRPDRGAHGRPGRLDRDAPRGERAALPDRVLGARSTAPCTRRRSSGSRCTSARSSRATSSTTRPRASTSAGRAVASSASRWRPRRSSPSRRSAASGRCPASTAGCLLTVSDIIVEGVVHEDHRRGAAGRGRPDDARRAHDRHRRLAPRAGSSSSSTRRPATARPGSAGLSSGGGPPSSACAATRCSRSSRAISRRRPARRRTRCSS